MKVLVTGGAGFIGSHLCERLLREGHDVVCLDNLFTGREQNVAHLRADPRFRFVRHDVVEPLGADLAVQRIYNLACPASPVHYQADPIKTVKTNFFGALHVLELAKKNGARVLQASTSEVYGDPDVHPQPESYWGNVNCAGVRSCYDEGKRVAETLFYDYQRQHQVQVRVARIFNTYGPRMLADDGRVVSNFVVQALRNEPLTIYGEGTQTRSFCYADDLVDGLVRLMESDYSAPVNLGNPGEFTVRELADMVLSMTRSRSTLDRRPLPPDDPRRRQPDISIARRELGWTPQVPLRAGLERTIAFFSAALK